ncbi:MAG TPA: CAP domain-containing protein [Eudoraea sp.]|nr:CAP domain-containing protein [Eudoraea sp.]
MPLSAATFVKEASALSLCLLLIVSCSKDHPATEEPVIIQTDNVARLAAKTLYEDYYLASTSNNSDMAWTGNEPNCIARGVPQSIKNKIFMRIAYYRRASGLQNDISESNAKSDKAQQAALMMKANNQLEHFPPDSWKCYTSEGGDGAGNSLLAMSKNAEAVDSYIRDQGSSNGPVGHRRWLLWPRLQEIGIGNTDSSNAIWVIGNAGMTPGNAPEFIAWPPRGYIPSRVVYPRWSFSIANADFTGTTVSMKDQNGTSIPLQLEELDDQFGDRTIVWVPEGINSNVMEDTVYSVTLEDVGVDGELTDFSYSVIIFDPNP